MIEKISDTVRYIGVEDTTLELFESQYTIEEGMRYNSYLILDEKVAIMDTVDDLKLDEWAENLKEALEGRTPDYLVITHMEPDHAAGIAKAVEIYPEIKVVSNVKSFPMMENFFEGFTLAEDKKVMLKEGDKLELGQHTLNFVTAPMVHWPEVMLAYDSFDKTLYSADAFGKFGATMSEEDWSCEARRYYYNIVGKYGANVQALLKKLDGVEVAMIAPLHGPILRSNIGYYVDMYDKWSRYQSEKQGVLVAYASIHGNTKVVAEKMAEVLKGAGAEKVKLIDLSVGDQSFYVEDAFEIENMVVAAASYDAGLFPPMEHFLHHLKSKNYQGRRVAIIENGSWAPTAGKCMKAMLESMKGLDICEEMITIRSAYKESDREAMERVAGWLLRE